MKTKGFFLSVCALLAVSCSQEADEFMRNQDTEQLSEVVTFNASFGQVATRATETTFESGDMVGVWAVQASNTSTATLKSSGNYADNIPYKYTGGTFNATGTGISLPSGDYGLAYYAVYPYGAEHTSTTNIYFAVRSDQNTHDGYTWSDLCIAKTNPTTSQSVNLTFNHVLSRIMVRLTGSALANKQVSVKLKNVLRATRINLQNTTFSYVSSEETDIQMLEESKNVFVAVVAPQNILANQNLLEITINGKRQLVSFDYAMTLNSGKQTTLTGEYTENGLLSFNGNINPWDEEGSVPSDVVPYDLQEKIKQYIPLYTGTTPPILEITNSNAAILFSPAYTVYCSDYQNGTGGGYAPGHIVNSSFWFFNNQNANTNTLDIQIGEFYQDNGNIQLTNYEEAKSAYICGSGNNFTACFNTTGVTKGKNNNQIDYKTATVISGTKTSTGISNMYRAFIMISKTGDTYNDLMQVDAFRVFKDQDGFSEYIEVNMPSSTPRRDRQEPPVINGAWENSAISICK